MFEAIVDWLIERRLKQRHISIKSYHSIREEEFIRVLNTLRRKKLMVKAENDGIYVRMAGKEERGECFSLEWGKVVSF